MAHISVVSPSSQIHLVKAKNLILEPKIELVVKDFLFQLRSFLWSVQNNILKVLRNPSRGNMLNSHQSKMCANKARQQYTPMELFLSFTPTTIKLYTMKVYMKSKTFCIRSFFENEFEYANEQYTNWICPKYIPMGFSNLTQWKYTWKVTF